ncbi:MAG TPA: hypothetical protein VF575_03570 [Candidatus Saccharimonadales bacterium]
MKIVSRTGNHDIFENLPTPRQAFAIGALTLVALTGAANITDLTANSRKVLSAVTPDFVGDGVGRLILNDADLGQNATKFVLEY